MSPTQYYESDDLIVQIICIGYVDQRVEFITFLLMALMRQYNYVFLPLPKYCTKVQSTRNFEKFELDVLK